ncbi:colanic acid biosynthesis glycosyltransferase WcaI [Mucilaginibacter limnophilus]|uniref:Colanic acid biosynthesis glycosyltransferase WcaI n=1 Tax=Mucilaginibacter limnophilus TaxID=1932778 RepID=A0A437MQ42_9SPHI|nr:WcaI family glycosyltransferase [Mucilaginibacter limnophilus]RVT99763.1 colanic acid biosynthesis glycosyltransferase WcaI [Mucilaginibacter limnophilus]
MRILVFGINYAPELTGIGKYTGEMCEWLASHGHEVNMITAMPYYPEWSVHSSHKGKWWHTEKINGVKVHRCPLYVPKEVSSMKRIIHEFTFLLSSLVYWFKFLFGQKQDVVMCIVPAFHLGFMSLLYSKIRGVKMIYHVQDLQVDAARQLDLIKNKTFLNLLFKMEYFILKHSNYVSTISKGMLNKILQKGIPEAKTFMLYNWVDTQHIRPLSKEQSLRSRLGLAETDKVVIYSGNLGEKQGLEIIVEAAAALPDVNFLIFGSGGGKEKLQDLVYHSGVSNVSFHPFLPYSELPNLLATGDIHLVLQKSSAADLVMPSKLTSILAAGGCPLVTALPGTSLYDIIHENDMGLLIAPDSAALLTDCIAEAFTSELQVIRANARAYARQSLDKDFILARFDKFLSTGKKDAQTEAVAV